MTCRRLAALALSTALACTSLLAAGCAASGPVASETEPAPEQAEQAEQRVNVGYGTVPRSKVTSAVSSVDPDDVGRPVARLEDLLAGRVAGVMVRPLPGGGISVMIRGQSSLFGSNEPLYVVDGTPLWPNGSRGLRDINPSDVESIQVLKDAGSTAIYDSRGANGVVLVTTKDAKDW